jgi:hypothetical protein
VLPDYNPSGWLGKLIAVLSLHELGISLSKEMFLPRQEMMTNRVPGKRAALASDLRNF